MQKIMFNDRYGLTDAVLEGRKIVTRRVIPIDETQGGAVPISFWNGKWVGAHGRPLKHQPYKQGEEIAIAQSYGDVFDEFAEKFYITEEPITPNFENFGRQNDDLMKAAGWTNKMFVKAELMPHRIRITDIRVERLQDISDEDCLREGISTFNYPAGFDTYSFIEAKEPYYTPREAFAALIDKVSGKGTWDSNPFVWVYSFELIK